jgi:hypothetical protein
VCSYFLDFKLEQLTSVIQVFDRLMYGGSSLFPFFGSMEDRFTFISGDVRTTDLDELVKGMDFVLNCGML